MRAGRILLTLGLLLTAVFHMDVVAAGAPESVSSTPVAAAPDSSGRVSDAMLSDAVARMNAQDWSGASKLLDRADSICPGNDAVKYYKGLVCAYRKDIEGALENFAAAYRLDSTNFWYKSRLAVVYESMGMTEKAEEMYRSMLVDKPYDLEIMASLMNVCLDTGKYNEADSLLNVMEKVQGPDEFITVNRLEVFRRSGRYTEFFDALNTMIATSKNTTAAEDCGLIESLLKTSTPNFNYVHLKEITRLVDTCVERYPTDTSATHFAAGFYYSLKHYDKIDSLFDANPSDFVLAEYSMVSAMQAKDYQKAADVCDRIMETNAGNTDILVRCHSTKADCLQYMGRTKQAYKEYEAALKLSPDEIVVLNNYAYFMACNGKKLAKCQKMSARVIELEGENPTYLDTYAYILHRRGKYAEAKVYFKKALLYGGKDHADILEHYADTLDALGEKDVASGYRQKAALKRKNAQKK